VTHPMADLVDTRLSQNRLQIRSTAQGTTHLISLEGELDSHECPRVEAELTRVEAGAAQHIVVDLGGVEFIDSTGIALLVAAMRRNEGNRDRLRFIVSESEAVQRLIELCGLQTSLPTVAQG
jgi:anti-sigma B factor antagonist